MKTVAKIFGACFILLGVMHTAEWFLEGRHVAKAAGIPVKKALPICLVKGILWWKPLKETLG